MRPFPVILVSLAVGVSAALVTSHLASHAASAAGVEPPRTAATPDAAPEVGSRTRGTDDAGAAAPDLAFVATLKLSAPLDREVRAAQLALRRSAADSTAWLRLGFALQQHARATLDVSLYAKIETIYRRAHRLDATEPLALLGLAWATGASHRFEDSVAWANLALQQDPDLAAAHGLLGDAAVELGNYAEAARRYQRMLDLKPDLGAYSRAGHLFYVTGNVPRATALLRQAIAAGGDSPEATAWCVAELSGLFAREGATLPARQLAEQALQRAPHNPTLLAAVGFARMSAGDDAGALAAYEESARIAPQHTTLVAIHDLHLAAGRREAADATARSIRELHASLRRQGIRGTEGQFARFLADRGENLDEAVALAFTEYGHHHTANAADTLAWALFRAGKAKDALPVAREAIKRRVTDATILFHAGLIEEAAGQVTDARRHLNAAVTRQPRFNPVHAPLAYDAIARLGSRPTDDLAQVAPAADGGRP